MSARADAIAAVKAATPETNATPETAEAWTNHVLNVIPADVLARLAIERGGLVQVSELEIRLAPSEAPIDHVPLYRVVES